MLDSPPQLIKTMASGFGGWTGACVVGTSVGAGETGDDCGGAIITGASLDEDRVGAGTTTGVAFGDMVGAGGGGSIPQIKPHHVTNKRTKFDKNFIAYTYTHRVGRVAATIGSIVLEE